MVKAIVYVNCILVTLNARNSIREAAAREDMSFNVPLSAILDTTATTTITQGGSTNAPGHSRGTTGYDLESPTIDNFDLKDKLGAFSLHIRQQNSKFDYL